MKAHGACSCGFRFRSCAMHMLNASSSFKNGEPMQEKLSSRSLADVLDSTLVWYSLQSVPADFRCRMVLFSCLLSVCGFIRSAVHIDRRMLV